MKTMWGGRPRLRRVSRPACSPTGCAGFSTVRGVLQDPLFAQRNRRAWTPAAGLEARPTIKCRCSVAGKVCGIGQICLPRRPTPNCTASPVRLTPPCLALKSEQAVFLQELPEESSDLYKFVVRNGLSEIAGA